MPREPRRSLRLTPDLAARLAAAAAGHGVSANWVAERLIKEGLDRLIPPEEFRLTRLRDDEEPDRERVALDDDEYLVAWWDGNCLWVKPCGLDGVMLRPEQQRRLAALLASPVVRCRWCGDEITVDDEGDRWIDRNGDDGCRENDGEHESA